MSDQALTPAVKGMSFMEVMLEWEEALKEPFLERFATASAFGLSVGFNPDGVRASHELLKNFMTRVKLMADLLDDIFSASEAQAPVTPFQDAVASWVVECFGEESLNDQLKRGDRFLEEVCELLQSGNYPIERARDILEYGWARPKGIPFQEVGGVILTLSAYCSAHNIDMDAARITEFHRVSSPEAITRIRVKEAQKPCSQAVAEAATPFKSRPSAIEVASAADLLANMIDSDMDRFNACLARTSEGVKPDILVRHFFSNILAEYANTLREGQ